MAAMKAAATLSLLSVLALARAAAPASTPVLVFNNVENLVSCQSHPITWIYAGPDVPLSLTITNVGVDQNPSTSSVPPNTLTDALFKKRYDQLQGRADITVTIAASISPAVNSYVWPTVLVPQGWYQILAAIQDPSYITTSSPFLVTQGSDTSCLGTSSSTTTRSSAAITSVSPSSTQNPSSGSPTSPITSTSPFNSSVPVGGSSSPNVGAIAGGTVAGFALLVIVALLYFFFVCRPRHSRRRALARQSSGAGFGPLRNSTLGHTGQGKYGGLTSMDSHHMLDTAEAGRNSHAGILGASTAGVAAAATAGLRGLDPLSAAGKKSRDRPDREKGTFSSSSNGPYGTLYVNTDAAPTRRHHDSQAESLATTVVGFGSGDGKEVVDDDNGTTDILRDSDRGISRSRSGSRAHGYSHSQSEEKHGDSGELAFMPSLDYEGAQTPRQASLSSPRMQTATFPVVSSPAIPGTARKTTRKPVPAYDTSLASELTANTVTSATPTTPTMDNPFDTPVVGGGHYAKRQPANPEAKKEKKSKETEKTKDTQPVSHSPHDDYNGWSPDDPRQLALKRPNPHELQHKSSFGPGGISGPTYELMPDILPAQGK